MVNRNPSPSPRVFFNWGQPKDFALRASQVALVQIFKKLAASVPFAGSGNCGGSGQNPRVAPAERDSYWKRFLIFTSMPKVPF